MTDNAAAWDHVARRYQADAALPTDVASYGPGLPTERDLRLLGDLKGKRVLELGCGGGQSSIAFAKQGASAMAVDASAEQIAYARQLAEREEARVEWHRGDLADLAFLRADSIDVAFSAFAVGYVEDLNRVLRQVHRVLKANAPFVFSYEHPMSLCTGRDEEVDRMVVARSYFDHTPVAVERYGERFALYPRTISEVFIGLTRAGYRVEVLLEPEPPVYGAVVPSACVWRARKVGA
jgi:ubiquinone/menaquinone biosynthesis C-methylase UbiE